LTFMPTAKSIPLDTYIPDILMRDLVGHDKRPAAFLVFLHLYARSVRRGFRPVAASLRMIADETGLSKSTVATGLSCLKRRQLVASAQDHRTAIPRHRVLRRWHG